MPLSADRKHWNFRNKTENLLVDVILATGILEDESWIEGAVERHYILTGILSLRQIVKDPVLAPRELVLKCGPLDWVLLGAHHHPFLFEGAWVLYMGHMSNLGSNAVLCLFL